jgi:K+-transporting ATPase ATPase C chain
VGNDITSALRPALVMTLLFALLLGLAYPLLVLGLGQALFPAQASGSLIRDGGKVIGSTVVGQAFTTDRYFQTRPSAAGKGYDGLASSGSNLGPTSRVLEDRVKGDVAKRRAEGVSGAMPADLVTTSGSGLDPDLSPQAALVQVARVAKARGLSDGRVRALVEQSIAKPLLGDPHVNVLALNRQLDRIGADSGR